MHCRFYCHSWRCFPNSGTALPIFGGRKKTPHIGIRSDMGFARVAITRNRTCGQAGVGIMGNFISPAQVSPCLRIFIASLLDESLSSGRGEVHGLLLAGAKSKENDSPRHHDGVSAQKHLVRVFSGRGNAFDARDSRAGHAVTNAIGGDAPKGK